MCVQKVHLSYLQAAYMDGFLINLFLIRALKKHVCLINDCVVFEELCLNTTSHLNNLYKNVGSAAVMNTSETKLHSAIYYSKKKREKKKLSETARWQQLTTVLCVCTDKNIQKYR